jgi:hypothetical protein
MLEHLQPIDPAQLLDVVRKDQRSVEFEITDWTVKRLSVNGIINPDGSWLWMESVVPKVGRPWAPVQYAFATRGRPPRRTVPCTWRTMDS